MILLLRLLITGIALFLFVITYLQDFDDRRNSLSYKLYLFLFMFLLQVTMGIFNNFIVSKKLSLNVIIENSVNTALVSVISYDIYNDLVFDGFYRTLDSTQKAAVLVLLVMGFITSIKMLQMLISTN